MIASAHLCLCGHGGCRFPTGLSWPIDRRDGLPAAGDAATLPRPPAASTGGPRFTAPPERMRCGATAGTVRWPAAGTEQCPRGQPRFPQTANHLEGPRPRDRCRFAGFPAIWDRPGLADPWLGHGAVCGWRAAKA